MADQTAQFKNAAEAALTADAGCDRTRAQGLVAAIGEAAAAEALGIVAGASPPPGTALDRRVALLQRIISKLVGERLPTEYEVGVIFRITPSQGRNVLRTYQARFSGEYRSHLQKVLGQVAVESKKIDREPVYTMVFQDPAVLDFAVEKLRRRGLTRTVAVDRTKLELRVSRDETDRQGYDAQTAIGA